MRDLYDKVGLVCRPLSQRLTKIQNSVTNDFSLLVQRTEYLQEIIHLCDIMQIPWTEVCKRIAQILYH